MKNVGLVIGLVSAVSFVFWLGSILTSADGHCCIHPNARNAAWHEIVSALAGSAGVLVALGLAYLGWSRKSREAIRFQSEARKNIIGELEHLARASRNAIEQGPMIEAVQADIGEGVNFIPARPYFEAIRPRIFELSDETIKAIYANEGRYMEHVIVLGKPSSGFLETKARLRHFQSVLIVYLQDLQQAYGADLKGVLERAGLSNEHDQYYSMNE